jgi:acetyltransferase-like isoleucine patch superfamily enzyme
MWVSQYPFPLYFTGASDIKNYGGTKGDVIIGSDVWLGANATILSGVSIGHGAVVACGALVTKNVKPYEVVAGNPARHIRFRFSDDDVEKLLEISWWEWDVKEVLNISTYLCNENLELFFDYAKSR